MDTLTTQRLGKLMGENLPKNHQKNTKHPRICKMRGVVLCQHLGTQSMPLELHRHLVDMMPQMSLKRTPTLIPRHNTEEYLNRCPKMKNPVTECFLTQARHLQGNFEGSLIAPNTALRISFILKVVLWPKKKQNSIQYSHGTFQMMICQNKKPQNHSPKYTGIFNMFRVYTT